MCIALPGKIIEINGDEAVVDYEAEKRTAKLITNDYKVGDYVFVQAKIVVQKIPKKDAINALNEWKRIMKNEN